MSHTCFQFRQRVKLANGVHARLEFYLPQSVKIFEAEIRRAFVEATGSFNLSLPCVHLWSGAVVGRDLDPKTEFVPWSLFLIDSVIFRTAGFFAIESKRALHGVLDNWNEVASVGCLFEPEEI